MFQSTHKTRTRSVQPRHLVNKQDKSFFARMLLYTKLFGGKDTKNTFRRQIIFISFLPPHHKLPVHHPRFRLHVRDVRTEGEGADVNGNCTLTNKIFQNFRRSIRCIAKYCFVHFLHFAIFFPETATFQSKNATFIILIFSELNIIGS